MNNGDPEIYDETYEGTEVDWLMEHNYDQRNASVYGSTVFAQKEERWKWLT